MAAMPEAVQGAEQSAKNTESGMTDLFGETLAVVSRDVYAPFQDVRRWSSKERLLGEKETLGLYVTGHPIDDYEGELRRFVPKKDCRSESGKTPPNHRWSRDEYARYEK